MGKADGNLSFLINNLTHGQFEFLSVPNQSILFFYQQNISDGLVKFVHDDGVSAPHYQVTVSNGTLTTLAQWAEIDFDAAPILLTNHLAIMPGQIVYLSSSVLNATHPGGDDRMLIFNITSLEHGNFSFVTSTNKPILNFYQQNITQGMVQFTHDNSTVAPSYAVSVSDGRITLPPAPAEIDFSVAIILEVNQLVINQGETIVLSPDNLWASQAGNDGNNLEFMVSKVQQGQFSWTNQSAPTIIRFFQQNVTQGKIQFTHNNSMVKPVYQVVVSDGRVTTSPADAIIDFDTWPVLMNNQLTVGEGQNITLSNNNLLAFHNNIFEPTLEFQITNIQNGGFILLSDLTQKFFNNVSFVQQQITNRQVVFFSQNASQPSYQVAVTDGRLTTPLQPVQVTFFKKPALIHNQFLVSRGQSTLLTTDNLAAITSNGTSAKDLQFVVSETVQHGCFEQRNNLGKAIFSFNQQDILQQAIQFTHDNSSEAPEYLLSVQDTQSHLSSDWQPGKTLLVINNYFPVTLSVTERVLNVTSDQPSERGNIVFTPIVGTVQHGYFAVSTAPNYPLINFQQQQITAEEIIFIPDGSTTVPSGYLSVSDVGARQCARNDSLSHRF